MFKLYTILFFVFLPYLTVAQIKADDVLGIYLTEIKDAKIQVYKKNGKFYGKVVWMADPIDENGNPQTDKENPIEVLQKRPILNMDILSNLSFDDDEWSGGTIYDPKTGDSYDCKIWLVGNTLKVRGYLGWLFDTKTWTKSNI